MGQWHPSHDGLTETDFLSYCDRVGFVAVAAALHRAVRTVSRAYYRLRWL